ncbi:hypothetical protein ACQKTA_04120 [Enterococcus sp. 22-H-5-01]|uniref:hypothetical protein n=1 Tax=Enterococcus sp. 22-H-5-01 TaxID=3418555 RepID=UPI003CFE025D
MKIYQPLEVKNTETGLWYNEWEISEGMPVPEGMVLVAPPENLLFPRWDNVQGMWIEDKDSIIEKMKQDNDELKNQLLETQTAIADVYEMISKGDEING